MTDAISYGGLALLLATGPVYLAQRWGVSRRILALCALVSVAACLMPWAGHASVFYVRGVVGDLSVSSLVLLMMLYGRALMFPVRAHQPIRSGVGWLFLAILLPLYASALGYWVFDLYSLGYEPQWMLLTTGMLLLLAWQMQPALAIAWLVGVVCFACGLTVSHNLWDVLFDPFMAFAGVAIVASSMIRAFFRKKTAKPGVETLALRHAA